MLKPIARPDQHLINHLSETADLCESFGKKLNIPCSAKLLGYLHDIGKYSDHFQRYIKSIAGIYKQGNSQYVNPALLKGKIDHATAGAQWTWGETPNDGMSRLTGQILAQCIASHHSGLIDSLTPEGDNKFLKRMGKDEADSHIEECLAQIPREIEDLFSALYSSGECKAEIATIAKSIGKAAQGSSSEFDYGLGFLARLCLSCLVDADHTNSAGRSPSPLTDWLPLCNRLEDKLTTFETTKPIAKIRSSISDQCLKAANKAMGTFQLTVPTGGGKTLASLRFALNHAKNNNLDRVIYVIPYTSIIDQNAAVVREILEKNGTAEQIVLEHHSNLTQKNDTERNRLLAENWDAPVVFTTLVQFLETLFSSGTRGVRRMHRLANSVIIFDEAQTLPINVIHMFNQSLNLLREQWNSSIVLCTATQPIFHRVDPAKGALRLSNSPDLIEDKHSLFEKLRRVEVSDECKPGGWSVNDVASEIRTRMEALDSILYITNTKAAARKVFEAVKSDAELVVHLSTNMCPAHRKEAFERLNTALDQSSKKVICISTQLIEAGVDISFDCVMRSLAGLDSIAQAAGRCNRHADSDDKEQVLVINPEFENLGSLEEMITAQELTQRVMREFTEDPSRFHNDLIGLEAMNRYYELFYFERASKMDYPFEHTSLLSLLSSNSTAKSEYKRKKNDNSPLLLNQSFMTANRAFEAIESATESVVVPYGEQGRELIGKLCSEIWDPDEAKLLRKQAQQYAVNVFPNILSKLRKANAIHESSEDSGIYYLNEQYYNETYGLSPEGQGSLAFLTT
jgi:CRISPR-associated endonuclease/helicase Cas3